MKVDLEFDSNAARHLVQYIRDPEGYGRTTPTLRALADHLESAIAEVDRQEQCKIDYALVLDGIAECSGYVLGREMLDARAEVLRLNARIRELEDALRAEARSLRHNFVGEDAEERRDIRDMADRMLAVVNRGDVR